MEKGWATDAASGTTSPVVSPTGRSPGSADPKLESGSSLPSPAPGDCQTSRQERMTPDRSRYAPQRAMLAIQSGLDTGQKCTQCANSARYTRLRTGLIAGILPVRREALRRGRWQGDYRGSCPPFARTTQPHSKNLANIAPPASLMIIVKIFYSQASPIVGLQLQVID